MKEAQFHEMAAHLIATSKGKRNHAIFQIKNENEKKKLLKQQHKKETNEKIRREKPVSDTDNSFNAMNEKIEKRKLAD